MNHKSGRATDLPILLFLVLSLPTFVVALVVARLVHGGGHLLMAWATGAEPIGLYLPLVGSDLALLNYPDAGWSGRSESLPYLLGGSGSCLVVAIFLVYVWPPSFGVYWRLFPHLLAAVLVVHGMAEPLASFSDRSEGGLAADLLGETPVTIWAVALAVALGLSVHLLLRASRLASVISSLATSGRRFLFLVAFWAVPEAAYQTARSFLADFDLFVLSGGLLLSLGPALAALIAPFRTFHQEVERSGVWPAAALLWLLAPALLAGWWVLFCGFVEPASQGVLWGEPGPFNNVRAETPSRKILEVLQSP